MSFPSFVIFTLLVAAAFIAWQIFGAARFLHGVFFFLALTCGLLLLKRLEKFIEKRRPKP